MKTSNIGDLASAEFKMPLFFFVLVVLVFSVLKIVGELFRYNLGRSYIDYEKSLFRLVSRARP